MRCLDIINARTVLRVRIRDARKLVGRHVLPRDRPALVESGALGLEGARRADFVQELMVRLSLPQLRLDQVGNFYQAGEMEAVWQQ